MLGPCVAVADAVIVRDAGAGGIDVDVGTTRASARRNRTGIDGAKVALTVVVVVTTRVTSRCLSSATAVTVCTNVVETTDGAPSSALTCAI